MSSVSTLCMLSRLGRQNHRVTSPRSSTAARCMKVLPPGMAVRSRSGGPSASEPLSTDMCIRASVLSMHSAAVRVSLACSDARDGVSARAAELAQGRGGKAWLQFGRQRPPKALGVPQLHRKTVAGH